MAEMLGYTVDEMLGMPLFAFMDQEGRAIATDNIERRRQGIQERHDFKFHRKDGSLIWTGLSTNAIFDDLGQYAGALAMVTDISEHKQAEEALRQLFEQAQTELAKRQRAEEGLRAHARQQAAVAKLGQSALADADLDALINEAVALVAQSLEVEYSKVLELLPDGNALLLRAGVGWHEGLVGHATVGAMTDSQAGYTLLSSQPVIVEDLRTETRFTGPPLLHDHGVISGISVIIQGPKQPFGVFGAHTTRLRTFTKHDIHFLQAVANVLATAIERKWNEQKIREQAALLNIATDAIFVRGLDSQILFWNKGAEHLYGWSSEEALGKNANELLYREITPQLEEAVKKVAESDSWQGELRKVNKSDQEIIVASRWTLVRDEAGQPKSILTVDTDITQKKKLEAQFLRNQRMESIGTLAGGIAQLLKI